MCGLKQSSLLNVYLERCSLRLQEFEYIGTTLTVFFFFLLYRDICSSWVHRTFPTPSKLKPPLHPFSCEMPHHLSPESSFNSKQELLSFVEPSRSGSEYSLASPDGGEQADALLSKTLLHSNADRTPDSYDESLYDETCAKRALYGDDPCEINFVPSESENLCGWGAFKPSFLQVFNTSKGVLFFLCAASFLQGMVVNGFINTVITSIERRFDLHSYHSGLIASSYDIAACVCLTFVSYFGGNGHKPRWLGWGVLIMGVGSLVFALPHFSTGEYEVNFAEDTGLCPSNHTYGVSQRTSRLSYYRYVFMLGQFLHGIGATPLYTLGVTYLDENVKSSYSPVYIGEYRFLSVCVL